VTETAGRKPSQFLAGGKHNASNHQDADAQLYPFACQPTMPGPRSRPWLRTRFACFLTWTRMPRSATWTMSV